MYWHLSDLAPGSVPYSAPKTRVIWDGNERRFATEQEAENFAGTLRAAGFQPLVCSH